MDDLTAAQIRVLAVVTAAFARQTPQAATRRLFGVSGGHHTCPVGTLMALARKGALYGYEGRYWIDAELRDAAVRKVAFETFPTLERARSGDVFGRTYQVDLQKKRLRRCLRALIGCPERNRLTIRRIKDALNPPEKQTMPDATPAPRAIRVRYLSRDGYAKSGVWKTVEGASRFARKWVGDTPERGILYAVSADGIGRVSWEGATFEELFPRSTK